MKYILNELNYELIIHINYRHPLFAKNLLLAAYTETNIFFLLFKIEIFYTL